MFVIILRGFMLVVYFLKDHMLISSRLTTDVRKRFWYSGKSINGAVLINWICFSNSIKNVP